MSLRVVVSTGGTGGHVFPALAVAQALKERDPGTEVLFLGGRGPEGDMARKAGVAFAALPAQGVLGKGWAKLAAPLWLSRAMVLALWKLRKFKPDCVVGFGGYAGFCPPLAAWMLGIPTAVHEQNSVPGAVNRVLSRVVDRVFASFEASLPFFPATKTVATGNPVRAAIAAVGESAKAALGRNLLVLGGSQGARAVNDLVAEAAPALLAQGVSIRHQAGAADADRVRGLYVSRGLSPEPVTAFIEDMAGAYGWADLILCRAGASTVFEAAAAGRPCLFIPFPHATHDHQRHNADAMARAGGARVMAQAGLTAEALVSAVSPLLTDTQALAHMARAARAFARPQAARDIARAVAALAGVPEAAPQRSPA
jgi:UDP-N-acetylglucosamine--N-acetylmuramyl-(pentapeptide) pyrophosphoryl-undecaprenol N-acetylglucosamine transferase